MGDERDQLKVLLDKHLANRPDAFKWLMDFWNMAHALDDIIDIPERRADNQFIGSVMNRYIDVFSADFYVNRRHLLYATTKFIHHNYFDSLEWELKDVDVAWKKTYADVLRCGANQILVIVVETVVKEETGDSQVAYEAAREVGLVARVAAWLDHHDEKGLPI